MHSCRAYAEVARQLRRSLCGSYAEVAVLCGREALYTATSAIKCITVSGDIRKP